MDIGGGLDPEELDFFFEEGVNEPIPQNNISSAIPNKPGRWWFSQSGDIPVGSPVAKKFIEDKNRVIADKENTIRREKSERKAEIQDRMSVYSRWFGSKSNQGGGFPPPGGGY
jgi:hypothetical protein